LDSSEQIFGAFELPRSNFGAGGQLITTAEIQQAYRFYEHDHETEVVARNTSNE